LPSNEPTNTLPPATAGEENTGPVTAVHRGEQVVGTPEQPCTPAASKAYTWPSIEPTYTVLPATVGDDCTGPAVSAVHTGVHATGTPAHPVTPRASKA